MSDNSRQVAQLVAQVGELTEELTAANEALTVATGQVDALTADLDASRAETVAAIEARKIAASAQAAAIERLTEELAAVKADADQARADYVALSARFDALPTPDITLPAALAAATAEIDRLSAELSAVLALADKANANYVALSAKFDALPPRDDPALSAQLVALNTEVARLAGELRDAKDRPTPDAMLTARIVDLEAMLTATPAPGSGILTVEYSDGRKKFAATDGNKYVTLAEAEHRMAVLEWMAVGLTETQAENAILRGSKLAVAA